jgi:hypothetical protein
VGGVLAVPVAGACGAWEAVATVKTVAVKSAIAAAGRYKVDNFMKRFLIGLGCFEAE